TQPRVRQFISSRGRVQRKILSGRHDFEALHPVTELDSEHATSLSAAIGTRGSFPSCSSSAPHSCRACLARTHSFARNVHSGSVPRPSGGPCRGSRNKAARSAGGGDAFARDENTRSARESSQNRALTQN